MLLRPGLVLLMALTTLILCAGVCAAAIVVPAPASAVPLIVLICVGCPMFAGWQVPDAVSFLRGRRAGANALRRLRKSLGDLPETEHPLGL